MDDLTVMVAAGQPVWEAITGWVFYLLIVFGGMASIVATTVFAYRRLRRRQRVGGGAQQRRPDRLGRRIRLDRARPGGGPARCGGGGGRRGL